MASLFVGFAVVTDSRLETVAAIVPCALVVATFFMVMSECFRPLGDWIQSKLDGTLPGLWLDTGALLSGDPARVLAVLGEGLASPEHVAFARDLAARRSRA